MDKGSTVLTCSDRPAQIDLLVLEYLAHAGYEKATQQLKVELRERGEGKQVTWRPVGPTAQEKVKERMLRALDRGERDEVLKLWDNFVPPLVRRSDKNAQKLEFYLNIFFAIFPLHMTNPAPKPSELSTTMRMFKDFLETDGAALAVTPEFLAYYAMPYVPEISRHPSFKELFTAEWARALKTRLTDFLNRTPQFASEPRLLGVVRSHRELGAGASYGAAHPVAGAAKDMQALKQRLIDSELRAVEAKREAAAAAAVEAEREAALKRGSKDVCAIAAEAISSLGPKSAAARALRQRLIGAEERLGLPQTQFPSAGDGGTGMGGVPSLGQWRGVGTSPSPGQRRGAAAGGTPVPEDGLNSTMTILAALDYTAIKRTMIDGGEDTPALMQAVRWRLTKPARRQRKTALSQYIQNDLLDAEVCTRQAIDLHVARMHVRLCMCMRASRQIHSATHA